ncbi:DUF5801 repeats-in-toxin domain-containing protein [Sphingopyxis alaskensis]|uniref:DUF5801 repeats-in-toxin domain-containing protein n=1 Tax=Sphingopyxis alaskensis TaxID=117207 RepID=UPI002040E89F|nr:DUF5801 domain-containing protein [Sphingopyxis alaskensis]
MPLGAPLTLVTADGSFTPQSVVTAYGTLNITGFTAVTGADGSVIGGTFTYSYTLADNRTDHAAAGQDDRIDSIGVTVTDSDGSSASATIDVRITDDVPDAIDDAATQTLENAPVTINLLANDVQGADSVQSAAVELVEGSLTGAGTLVNNGDGSFTYTPAAQETGIVSFQYRITDGDNDTDVATATITLVADSQPQIRNADDAIVDEDGLSGANLDNGLPGEVTSTGSASASGTITVDFGSDIPAVLAGSLVLDDSSALDTQLTVDGVPVTFARDGDDLVGSVGGSEVIRISLTGATAGPGATEVTYSYSVTLSQAIDQAVAGSEDSDLLVGIGFTVTDSDNSTASGSFDVTIVDDLPTLVVSDTPVSAVEGGPAVEGSWSLDPGADGVTSILVTFGSESGTLTLPAGAPVVLVQPTGTLTVNADGSFSFLATGDQDNDPNPSATFTLSAVDGDGDPTSDSLTITILDGADPVGGDTLALTVNEAAIDGIGRTPASDAETDSGTLSFTAGSDTLGDFAFTGVGGLVTTLDGVGVDIFWILSPDGQTITGSLTDGGPAAITISLTAPASIAPGATDTLTVTVTLADNLPHELAMAAQTQALGTVTVVGTDTDGDPATGTVTIAVTDDIPTIGAVDAAGNQLTVDDSDLASDATADFGIGQANSLFTAAFNADGPAAMDAVVYTLAVKSPGVDSGLVDTATGEAVVLTIEAGVVVGRTSGSGEIVFTLSVDANGTVTLDQQRPVFHTPDTGPDQSAVLDADDLITLTATITDSDGDPASATANIGGALTFKDDGVSIDISVSDEAAVTLTTQDADTIGSDSDADVSTANFDGAFSFANADFGADGAGTISWNYVLSLFGANGTDSQLDSNGQSIFLFNDGGVIKGSTAANLADVDASNTIFTIAVDASDGTVTLTQFAEIDHADDGATSNFDSQLATLANGLVRLTGTVTIEDRDGDQDVASQTIDLGGNVRFADDGPTISAAVGGAGVVLDESGGFDSVTSITPVIAATFDFGADGAASGGGVTYSIELTGGGLSQPSGLATAVGDFPITLVQTSATMIVGRFDSGSGDQDAFTIVINSDGTLTVTQLVALEHLIDGESATDHDDALTLTGLVTARITVEDGDGDTVTSTTEIGDQISFLDDGLMANPDSNSVTEGAVVNGNVLTDNADVFGTDGADATTPAGGVVGVRAAGGDTTTPVTTGTGTVISTIYGDLTLHADGSYTYDAKPNTTSVAVEDVFVYTIRDADGDTSTTTLTIAINPVTLVADNQTKAVDEAGLDLNQDGDDVAAGTVTGSNPAATTETVTGTLNVTGAGSIAYTPQDVEDALGRFVLNSDGTYSYTLKSAFDGATLDNGVTTELAVRSFNYTATDANGNSVTGTVTIDIVDDVPTARADSDSVTEDGPLVADGNVLTGAGGGDANTSDGVADTPGADGAIVTGVATGMSAMPVSGNVGSPLVGSYGSLTLAAGGGYTYTLNNANPAVQALGATETLTETFTYTITDGDGDTSTTTLTITINGSNDAPTLGTATTAVSDEGLAGGLPDSAGTVDTTNLTVRMGTIAVGDVDGDALTVSLGIPATALTSGGQPIVWDNSDPHLLLGKVGTTTIISIAIENDGDFTVTLSGPIDHPDTTQEDAVSLVVPVSVFDGTTTVTNANALTIGLEDDSPIAVAPVSASLTNVGGSSVLRFLDSDNDVDNNFGGDGGKVIFTAATIAALQAQGLTSGLQSLTYSLSANGQVLTAEKPNGDDVFIITLQPAGSPDQYRVEIIRPIDSVQTVDFNDGGYNFVGGNGSWAGFTQPGDNNSQDLLLTPMTNGVDGGTVNTNANEGGISGGNSVGSNEAMRVDFVIDLTGSPASGQDYGVLANQNHAFDAHYTANGASALFTAINPGTSSVRIVARDDIDSDNDIGDGVKDTITGVAISFNGVTTQVTVAGTYNVGGVNFTVAFSGGEATVSGVVSNTRIAAFTADGYNSIEFHYAGGATFKIGDFGASLIVNQPVSFTAPVAVIDGDGDTSALANISVTANPVSPPIVLDLDGDGAEYLSAAAGVTFDYAGTGAAITTAWVGSDDGLLAFDANANGRVDDGTEIVFGGNGLTDLQGLAARFDSNGDGVLDSKDADFARFGVWQDANSNGLADDGEFRTLDQAGIISINLVSDGQARTTADGDVHVFGESRYTLADGTVRTVADAAFARTETTRSQDRPATAMPLADALVAASLIAMAQGVQAGEREPTTAPIDDGAVAKTVDEGIALADVAETGAGSAALDPGTDVVAAARVVDTAAHHIDTAFQATASIADSRDNGWRGEDMIARDGGSSDALFDAPSPTAGAASAMDGLLMLGLAAAEAATAQATSVSAQDPAATAVLAEVLDDGRVDHLIDAIAGADTLHLAAGDAPVIDLARLLDAPVANDMAVFVHSTADMELQQLATA